MTLTSRSTSRAWWRNWRGCSALAAASALLVAQSPEKANTKGKDLGGPGGVIAVNGVRNENLPPPPEGPAPRFYDGKPDLPGVWLSGNYSFSNMGGALP